MRGDDASQTWSQPGNASALRHTAASAQEYGDATLRSLPGGSGGIHACCVAPTDAQLWLGLGCDPGRARHSQQRHPVTVVPAPSSLSISQRLGRLWHAPTLDTGVCSLARQAAASASRPASLLELALLAETRPWQQPGPQLPSQQQPQQHRQPHTLPPMQPHAQLQRWQQSQPQLHLQQQFMHAQVQQVQVQQQPQQSLLTAQQWRPPTPHLQQQRHSAQCAADWQPSQHHRQLPAGRAALHPRQLGDRPRSDC